MDIIGWGERGRQVWRWGGDWATTLKLMWQQINRRQDFVTLPQPPPIPLTASLLLLPHATFPPQLHTPPSLPLLQRNSSPLTPRLVRPLAALVRGGKEKGERREWGFPRIEKQEEVRGMMMEASFDTEESFDDPSCLAPQPPGSVSPAKRQIKEVKETKITVSTEKLNPSSSPSLCFYLCILCWSSACTSIKFKSLVFSLLPSVNVKLKS